MEIGLTRHRMKSEEKSLKGDKILHLYPLFSKKPFHLHSDTIRFLVNKG